MYNPKKFRSDDQWEAFSLMDKYPFATLISVADGNPFVSHLPLTPKKVGSTFELIGHCARANPHWKYLNASSVTAIFHGPHTYITPKWYAENDVPTWNYLSVHTYGRSELVETQEGILECLQDLTNHVERHWASGWNFFVPEDLLGEMLPQSIVGFRIRVESISFKKKLSQNRIPADREGILKGLEKRHDENSRAVLEEMKKLYGKNGSLR